MISTVPYKNARNIPTLTCEKTSVVRSMGLKRSIDWGMVITVMRSDAPNTERTNIFLLRESPTFFQRNRGAATRERSARMSAAEVEKQQQPKNARGTD